MILKASQLNLKRTTPADHTGTERPTRSSRKSTEVTTAAEPLHPPLRREAGGGPRNGDDGSDVHGGCGGRGACQRKFPGTSGLDEQSKLGGI